MKSEILKQIDGYPEYWVSSIGNVYSSMKGGFKKLKPVKDKGGYLSVRLYNKNRKWFKIHRLVAQAFIQNTENLPQVNHKNEDKTDNRVCNLEWCTAKYNINYGSRNYRMAVTNINGSKSKTVYQYNLESGFMKEWSSTHEIERQTGFSRGNISACCLGKLKTAYGYRWSYIKV